MSKAVSIVGHLANYNLGIYKYEAYEMTYL